MALIYWGAGSQLPCLACPDLFELSCQPPAASSWTSASNHTDFISTEHLVPDLEALNKYIYIYIYIYIYLIALNLSCIIWDL